MTADLFDSSALPAPALRVTTVPAPPTHGMRHVSLQLWYAAVFADVNVLKASDTLQRLCLLAQRFTPLVSIEMPNALLLEIKGSVHLYGTLDNLHAGVDAVWSKLALRAMSAIAPTALTALWLARGGEQVRIEDSAAMAGALAALPVACTGWNEKWLQTLRSMGIARMGDLQRLPRSGLARRLSPQAVADLDVALARQAAPRRSFVPQERFRERRDFEAEIETAAYVQKAVEPLIENCARFLRQRQSGLQSLQLKLRHRAICATRISAGFSNITSERRRLSKVFEEKLHRLELAAPVRAIELSSGALRPLTAESLDAFAGSGGMGRDTAPQLVERLRARLGEESVYGLCSRSEHRPEAAWQRVLSLSMTSSRIGTAAASTDGDGMPRPVWLMDAPVQLSSADLRCLQQGDWILEQGPERIESGWWDGCDVTRDYYIARQSRGARWWVFQERHTQCWYLHGVFA